MGMFDSVVCEMLLPDAEEFGFDSTTVFQTKSLENVMATYIICADGRLCEQEYKWIKRDEPKVYMFLDKEVTVDTQRVPTGHLIEYKVITRHCAENLPFHGYVEFYEYLEDHEKYRFVTYMAKFVDGICVDIKCYPEVR